MINGRVTPDREAIIELAVFDAQQGEEVIEAIIDTGFKGYLTLPSHLNSRLNLPRAGNRRAALGNGKAVVLDAYFGEVSWHGQAQEVLVLEADGGPLVGMSLLYGNRLVIEVLEEGEVTIEPLPDWTA